MIIPNFENIRVVDNNGYFTPEWQIIMQNLFQMLQQNLSNEGFLLPKQNTSTINDLQSRFNASSNPDAYYSDLLYDSTTDELKVNIAGTFKVIQVI